MRTDVHTAMMKAVDFIVVCAKVPKDAVQYQSRGIWKHAIWLHIFYNLPLLSGS